MNLGLFFAYLRIDNVDLSSTLCTKFNPSQHASTKNYYNHLFNGYFSYTKYDYLHKFTCSYLILPKRNQLTFSEPSYGT